MVELAEAIAGARELALFELLRQRLVRPVKPAAPAVGQEWSAAVPSGSAWEVLSVRAQLVTSAAVANRVPILRALDDGGSEVWRIGPAAAQAASLTVRRSYLPSFGYLGNVADEQLSLPGGAQVMQAGWTLGSLTTLLDGGDAYSGIVLVVREWSPTAMRTALDWLEDHYR